MTLVGEFDLIRDLLAKVNPAGAGAHTGTDGEDRKEVGSGGVGSGVRAPGVWLGAGDDAAVLDEGRVVMSTDLTVEDVHFRRSWVTFAEAGARAVAAAASDLAAMAAAARRGVDLFGRRPPGGSGHSVRTRRRVQGGIEGARCALGGR